MKLFIITFWIFINFLFYDTIVYSGWQILFLFNLFIAINISFLWGFLNDLRKNIVYIFLYTGWIIYSSLGMVRECYIGNTDVNGDFSIIILWFIFASILMFIGIYIVRSIKIEKGFSFVENMHISVKTFVILISLDLLLTLYKLYIAGGLHAFIYASYGSKVESDYMTFFSLFPGILSNVLYFTFPFIRHKAPLYLKIISIFYFLVNIVMGVLNGSSMSIFNPLLALFTYFYLTASSEENRVKIKQWSLGLLLIGIVGGVLIRQNRTNYAEFSTDVLNTSVIDKILESSTFDNFSNLKKIFEMSPTYTPGQLIYPYINYLPRSTFPWKPMELGRIIAYDVKGMDNENLIGFLPSPIGEFYYDYGYLGIILGMFYVGLIIAFFQEKMNRTKNSPWKLSILLAFSGYTTIISGWYTGFGVREVRLAIFIILLLLINRFFTVKRERI